MKRVKLGSLITEIVDKTTENNQYEVLTSSQRGIFSQEEYFTKQVASQENTGYKVIRKGEFTYRSMSDTGAFYINRLNNKEIGIVSPAYPVFKISSKELIPEYLEIFFQSSYFQHQISNKSTGSTRLALKFSKLCSVSIPLPTHDKQKKIINSINLIKKTIEMISYELVIINELIKSRFVEMFGDEHNKVKLEKIAKIGSSHRVFVDEFVESGVPFYRGTEIGLLSQGITDFKPYYISKSRYNELTSDYTKPEIGDILMPSICDKGQLWIVNTIEPFYYKDGRVLSIRPDKDIVIPEFLHYFLKIKLTEIYKEIATGATFAEFKIFLLKDIDVVLPTICKQKKFTDVVQQVDKLKFIVEEQLKLMNELLNKKMDEYFN